MGVPPPSAGNEPPVITKPAIAKPTIAKPLKKTASASELKSGEVADPLILQPLELEEQLTALTDLCRRNLRNCDIELIRKAFYFCIDAHIRNIRASGEPYYTHPLEVAMIVAREIPLDDVSVAAALLHDVVEDTEYTIEDIRAEFGPTVAEIVDGATKITD
ncbi:MAG: HD domain-containing protein, partial [Candidatus Kapaibacterium sp.]